MMMIRLHYKGIIILFIWMGICIGWPKWARANDDFIVILDQSGSMKEKQPGQPKQGYERDPMRAQKSSEAIRALHYVVSELLRLGDYFALITFGDSEEIVISQVLKYEHERESLKYQISQLSFNQDKTDIVAGMQQSGELLARLKTPHRRKILFLVTDGRNEPRDDSPFQTMDKQHQVYQRIKKDINNNDWKVNLVGLGSLTDLEVIAKQLALPQKQLLLLDRLEPGRIKALLEESIKRERDQIVKLRAVVDKKRFDPSSEPIEVTLQPKRFGGYRSMEVLLELSSTFPEEVAIKLDPQLTHKPSGQLKTAISVSEFTLVPQQPKTFVMMIGLAETRPSSGRIEVHYTFEFDNSGGKKRFYPHDGNIVATVPSWWEYYGTFAITVACIVFILLVIIGWLLYQMQVPVIRVSVTAQDEPLGEPMRLHKGEDFVIGNNQFGGRFVNATGLNCNRAASVRYLGRRQFQVNPEEAFLVQVGEPVDRSLRIGLDEPFDLRDHDGRTLREVAISTRRGNTLDAGFNTDSF